MAAVEQTNRRARIILDLSFAVRMGIGIIQQSVNDYAETRTDRVLFGFELAKGSFAHHYVMRRTQAGSVTHPGAYVEAMYAPDIHARSAAVRLK